MLPSLLRGHLKELFELKTWAEVLGYWGIRYYVRLFLSVCGNGVQGDVLSRLSAAEEITVVRSGDECRNLLLPLID